MGKVYFHLEGDFGALSNPIAKTGFLDVAPNDYYGPSVCWAWKNEIVSGYNDDMFAQNDVLTKERLSPYCTVIQISQKIIFFREKIQIFCHIQIIRI